MLGSILTRQYRFATRGIEIGLQTAQQAIDVAGGLAGEVAGGIVGGLAARHGRRNGDGRHNGHGEDDVAAAPERPLAPTLTPEPPPAADAHPGAAPGPTLTPEPPRPRRPLRRHPEPAAHVSTEPELVQESADRGAEDGAGAQVRVGEPWPGYRSLKARDVVARLPFATREELAAVELFERAGANRKSVVVAAQRALKKASPPR